MDIVLKVFLVIVLVAVYAVAGYLAWSLIQKSKVREWLIYATGLAEKELGGGTGQMKLRLVYDMFITKFPFLVKIISFKTFSKLVDSALKDLNKMLDTNNSIKDYIEKKE